MRQQGDAPEIVNDQNIRAICVDYSDGPNRMKDLCKFASEQFPDGYLLDAREVYSGAFTLRRYIFGVDLSSKQELGKEGESNGSK